MSKADEQQHAVPFAKIRSALSRTTLLEAHKQQHKELWEKKKQQHKVMIIANVRKRHPHAVVKQHAPTEDLTAVQQQHHINNKKKQQERNNEEHAGKLNYRKDNAGPAVPVS